MSSLQDQLLKAGLVDEKKLAQANREKNRKDNLKRHSKNKKKPAQKKRPAVVNQKAERDRELNQKRQQAARRKEQEAQVKQLIDNNKEDRSKGELAYSFVYKKKVKKIFITAAQKQQLVAGRLQIVTYVIQNDGRKFDLVPLTAAEKIKQRDPDSIVDTNAADESQSKTDDFYAGFEVPDDLDW